MKKLISLLLSTVVSVSLIAQEGDKEPYQVQNFSGNINNLEVKTSGGNITVKGGQSGNAKVEVYIRSGNYKTNLSKSEIEKRLTEDYELKMVQEGNALIISARRKKNNNDWKNGLSISFSVFVPENVATNLTTSGGNINISKLIGKQVFSTSGGNLVCKELKGDIQGTTSGGNITIEDSRDNIRLSTSGGNITAENCSGNITISTSGGNLNLEKLEGTIKAKTSGGNVNGESVKGELEASTSGGNVDLEDLSASVYASTSGGSMTVEMKELGKYITLKNSSGRIELTLPANKGVTLDIRGSKINTTLSGNFDGKIEDTRIKGTLNGGGIPVTVDAGSGRVSIDWK
ncbi:MAG: DUF4097 family beta strand repeat-containing protein [Chitinophagaceae bacterium]